MVCMVRIKSRDNVSKIYGAHKDAWYGKREK